MIFNTIISLCVCLFMVVVSGKELRSVVRQVGKSKLAAHLSKSQGVKTQNAASFPTNPQYTLQYLYSDAGCQTVENAASIIIDTCLQGTNSSFQVTCSGGTGTFIIYSDTACTVRDEIEIFTEGTCFSTGDGGSARVESCSATNVNQFRHGYYVATALYQDNTCTQPLVAAGEVNGRCYQDESENLLSYKWDWPKKLEYNGSIACNLVNPTSTVTVPTTCNSVGATDDPISDNTYQQFSYVNAASQSMHLGVAAVVSVILAVVTLF